MARETAKRTTFVPASPYFTGRCAEIETRRIARVGRHRLPFDGPPRLCLGQAMVQSFPRAAAVTRSIHGGTAAGRSSRPYRRAIHRKNPQRVGIARMRDDRKADMADATRHRRANVLPLVVRPVDSEDAAVILLIQTIRMPGGKAHAMWIVSEFCLGIRKKIGTQAPVQRLPIHACVNGLEDAARRHRDVNMFSVARIDENRMQRRSVRWTVLVAAAPRLTLRMTIEAVDAFPCRAAVQRTEQAMR